MPSWNGNPMEFEDYKIGCERLVDGTKDEDQHLLGPRLAARHPARWRRHAAGHRKARTRYARAQRSRAEDR